MLPSVDSLNQQLLALPPTLSSLEGATQFVNTIAAFMDQVQAGPTGTAGIFTFDKAPAIAAIQVLPPVKDNSWIVNFANAIHTGTTAATLVPGTVTSPIWTVSSVDVSPPVIITLGAALSTLIADLAPVLSLNNPALPMAQAINNYTLAFTFLCTGIAGTPISPVPTPIPFPAE